MWGVLALLVALLVALGGYRWFSSSDAWREIQGQISTTDTVVLQMGPPSHIDLSPVGFRYSFAGDNAKTHMRVRVAGAKGTAEFDVTAERKNGVWRIAKIESR